MISSGFVAHRSHRRSCVVKKKEKERILPARSSCLFLFASSFFLFVFFSDWSRPARRTPSARFDWPADGSSRSTPPSLDVLRFRHRRKQTNKQTKKTTLFAGTRRKKTKQANPPSAETCNWISLSPNRTANERQWKRLRAKE